MHRIQGLDSIRFVLATLVVLSHLGMPPIAGEPGQSILNANINGVAAVMGFFVISGFCIHFPFRQARPTSLSGYYLRRYVRIGLPMAVAMLLGRLLGLGITPFEESVLWSLYAEIAYYTIYPGLIWLKERVGWQYVIGGSFLCAVGVVASDPSVLPYHGHGPWLTWLLGLPCWLMGCYLAEIWDGRSAEVADRSLWAWRGGVWGMSVATLYLRYHSPVGLPITLTLFSPLVATWLWKEMHHFRRVTPPSWLEKAGQWSYSLYLMHMPTRAVLRSLGQSETPGLLGWCLLIGTTLAASYLFFLLVERPSHLLARMVERRRIAPRPEQPVFT